MRIALLLPFSPTDPANSGVARLEMFKFMPGIAIDRFHFGPASKGDHSIGTYYSEASPRNLSSLFRLLKVFKQQHCEHPYDLIWTTMPPILMALFSRVVAKRCKVPLVVDVRDPGIASVVIVSPPGTFRYRLAHRFEKWLYKGASAICVTTPELATMLNKEFSADPKRITVISNATVEKVKNSKKMTPTKVKVFYAGTFAPYQVVDPLIDNLLKYKQKGNFQFDFYGYREEANPSLEAKVAGHSELQLHPRLPRAELFKKLKESDIVIVPIELKGQKDLYDYAVPLKLYEALAFSKPVLLFGGTAASIRLVKETHIGEVTPVEKPIYPVLQKIVDDYAAYAKAAETTVFSREIEGKKLGKVFESL